MDLPYELMSYIGLLTNDPVVLKEMFEFTKHDSVSYVKLCEIYPWRGYRSDNWYEDTYLIGGPHAMRYLYQYKPNSEFLRKYWVECIDYDIVRDVPLPIWFNYKSFLNILRKAGPRALQYCYDRLSDKDRSYINCMAIDSCNGNHRALRWLFDTVLVDKSFTISPKTLQYRFNKKFYSIIYENRERFKSQLGLFCMYVHLNMYYEATKINVPLKSVRLQVYTKRQALSVSCLGQIECFNSI